VLPVAWWPLDTPVTGERVPDASGHGNDLTLLNGPGSFTDKSVVPSRTSLRLDRSKLQWGSTSGPLVDTTKQFSWSAWVRLDLNAETASDAYNYPVIAQEGSRNSFALARNAQGLWVFYMPASDASAVAFGSAQDTVASPDRAVLGAWTHLAGGVRQVRDQQGIPVRERAAGRDAE
jgi:hypothetical protein